MAMQNHVTLDSRINRKTASEPDPVRGKTALLQTTSLPKLGENSVPHQARTKVSMYVFAIFGHEMKPVSAVVEDPKQPPISVEH